MASFVTAVGGGPIEVKAAVGRAAVGPMDFLVDHGRHFGVSDARRQLVQSKVDVDALGQVHTTYRQVHRGIPVFSGILKVHQDAAGGIVAANGDFHPLSPQLETTTQIDADEAEVIAQQWLTEGDSTVEKSELVIVDPGWYGDAPRGARLAHHIILGDVQAGVRQAFFVDAETGEILDSWNMIHRLKNRRVHDASGGISLPGPLARAEGDGPTGVPDVDAAYDYSGDVYDYFKRAFGRDSIDGAGMQIISTVNTGAVSCPNAFWNGTQAAYCSGAATDDVVGHEIMHGITEFTANLIYQNQSGQLNESYSDVFGELVDLFNGNAAILDDPGGPSWPTHETGPGTDEPNERRVDCEIGSPNGVRWLIAEDGPFFGGAIRDMWDPPCRGDPDRANSSLQTCNPNDNGGVHSGSGIPNHAFAMLTDGKRFNGFTVGGIGPIKSAAVWYRALTVYLTPASDFVDAYEALNQAAADLVGTFPNDPRTGQASLDAFSSDDAVQVDNALLAVEMNTVGRCGAKSRDRVLPSDEPFDCPSGAAIFEDGFEDGVNGWIVFNSGPPTPYDWVQLPEPLPFGRSGTAWYVENRGGSCSSDESSTHSLVSPAIDLPASVGVPLMSFTHFMESDAGWDGGNVRIRVNGGLWEVIPRTAFLYNPYNAILNAVAQGNTNPMAGEAAWSGVGLNWGTSIVDLSGLVGGGDRLEVRFDFGKNCVRGAVGWYLDDFSIVDCGDCDGNGLPDYRDFAITASAEMFVDFGVGQRPQLEITFPPEAVTDVTLTFVASADLVGGENRIEWIDIDLNAQPVGSVFEFGAQDCPGANGFTPDIETLVIPRARFNEIVIETPEGPAPWARFRLTPTEDVNAETCASGYVGVFVTYGVLPPEDCNSNGIADACEPDCNGNGVADECEVDSDGDGVIDGCDACPGGDDTQDADGDGVPDRCDECPGEDDGADRDGDGVPDCLDNCPDIRNADQADRDGDGVGDACVDCNGNGVADSIDVGDHSSEDCNGNGIPDECDGGLLAASVGPDLEVDSERRFTVGEGLSVAGGVPPIQYEWTLVGAGSPQLSTATNPAFGPLPAGVYSTSLVVTDAVGCKASDSMLIRVGQQTNPPAVAPPSGDACASSACGMTGGMTLVGLIVGCLHLRSARGRRRRRS